MYVCTHAYVHPVQQENKKEKQKQKQKQKKNANAYAMCFLVRDNAAPDRISISDEIPNARYKDSRFSFLPFTPPAPTTTKRTQTPIRKHEKRAAHCRVPGRAEEERRQKQKKKKKQKNNSIKKKEEEKLRQRDNM